jgi:ABC-2 type transport system ATP-binding protein
MAIEFTAVTKRYRDVVALNRVTFTASAGRITGFVGRNGAGKTTALRILLGLTRADSGTATIDRRTAAELPVGRVGVLLEPAFHPGRCGRAHLRATAAAIGLPDSAVDLAIAETDLRKVISRRIGGYSLGQRQRLGLATALLGQPRVLILDEPTNGLDPDGIRWLRMLLRRAADNGAIVLVSSHLLSELEQVVDDVVILDRTVLWAGSRFDIPYGGTGGLEALYQHVVAGRRGVAA